MVDDERTLEERIASAPPGGIVEVTGAELKQITKPRQFYGHTNAQHGVHAEPAPGPTYENPEVKDLHERIRKKFKEIGYEF